MQLGGLGHGLTVDIGQNAGEVYSQAFVKIITRSTLPAV